MDTQEAEQIIGFVQSLVKDGKLVKPEPEKWAEQKAAFLEGKAIESHGYNSDGQPGSWSDDLAPRWDTSGWTNYCIKPWSLSRHLPGFRPLRDGEEWHKTGWRESDLPVGWRPLLNNERCEDGDEFGWPGDKEWTRCNTLGGACTPAATHLYRTRRPLPEPPKLIPLDAADWMKDGPWWIAPVKNKENPQIVISATKNWLGYMDGTMSHERAMAYVRSNDGINWSPCHKPA